MNELPARLIMGAGLSRAVDEEILLLRALAVSRRTAAFASFQKREVNRSPQTSGFDGVRSSSATGVETRNVGSFVPASPRDRLDSQ
jgi:hypothetical protein